jgi:hypothetical protein
VRLAAAFAAALLVVLALAAVFVYLRVSSELTGALDDELETRAAALSTVARGAPPQAAGPLPAPNEGEEGFSQVLAASGEVIASTRPPAEGSAIDEATLRRASREAVVVERPLEEVEDEARILAAPAGAGERVVVAAATTEDRSEALGGILGAVAIGIPLAILLAFMATVSVLLLRWAKRQGWW